MNAFKSLWTMIRLLWQTVIGQLALDSLLQVVNSVGKSAADTLAAKAKIKVAKLEAEYPDDQPEKKRADALNWIADEAASLGVSLGSTAMSLIIELAVSSLKSLGAKEVSELAAEEL